MKRIILLAILLSGCASTPNSQKFIWMHGEQLMVNPFWYKGSGWVACNAEHECYDKKGNKT